MHDAFLLTHRVNVDVMLTDDKDDNSSLFLDRLLLAIIHRMTLTSLYRCYLCLPLLRPGTYGFARVERNTQRFVWNCSSKAGTQK